MLEIMYIVEDWARDVSLYSRLCMHQPELDVSGCEGQGTVCIQEMDRHRQTCNEQHFSFSAERQAQSSIPND